MLVGTFSLVLATSLAFNVATPRSALAETESPALMPASGQYFSISPVKVLDTRNGTGGVPTGPVAAGSSLDFPVEGVGGVPANGVTDVYAVITAINPMTNGCLHDYDADLSDPGICTVSFQAGDSFTDSDLVQVGAAGYVAVTNASSGATGIAVTVLGYYQDGDSQTAGETYVPLPQAQIVDTRSGLGAPQAQIPGGSSLTVQVAGHAGVPSDAAGAALFIGAANATQSGYLSAYPTGGTASSLANLSYSPGRVVHNLYFGALSSSGQLTVVNQGPMPVDILVGVQGFLVSPTAPEAGDQYQDVPESRIADTRSGNGGVPATPIPAGGSITIAATGVAGVPSTGVASVAESVAALNPTAKGYLSVYPADGVDPGEPGVNFDVSDTQDNDMSAPLLSAVSPSGQEKITNHSSGSVDVVVSVRGYFIAPTTPSAPTQVNAGIQDGSAIISWAAPQTDGGGAITSYDITVFNDDGTVNQTLTAGPADTSATITDLGDTATYSIGIAAVNGVGAGDSSTGPVNVIPAGWSAPSTSETDDSVIMDVDPSTGDLTFDSATSDQYNYAPDGTLISSNTQSPADITDLYSGTRLGTFSCVLSTSQDVHGHTPWHNTQDDPEREFDFYHETYTAKNARTLYASAGSSYKTFQDLLCNVGGGQSKNVSSGPNEGYYHLWFVGTATTLSQKREYEIGKKWGTGQTNGSVSINLNFVLTAGPASVAAAVAVNPGGGNYQGDIGNDGLFPNYPKGWQPYYKNRVNMFWRSPHTFPWNGAQAGDYEGNASEVLYEWPMGTTGTFKILAYAVGKVFYVNPG